MITYIIFINLTKNQIHHHKFKKDKFNYRANGSPLNFILSDDALGRQAWVASNRSTKWVKFEVVSNLSVTTCQIYDQAKRLAVKFKSHKFCSSAKRQTCFASNLVRRFIYFSYRAKAPSSSRSSPRSYRRSVCAGFQSAAPPAKFHFRAALLRSL